MPDPTKFTRPGWMRPAMCDAQLDRPLKRGDQFVAYPDRRPCERLYVEVTRVAKDRSWADIKVKTWAVMWTKRQPLKDGRLPGNHAPHTLTEQDLEAQETDHLAKHGLLDSHV